MDDDRLVAVSPQHSVRLAREYVVLIEQPPQNDYVVRTIARREANGLPLMTAEIVVAGRETRERHPLSVTYPLQFRKTYSAARLNGDTAKEFENQTLASQILGLPPPIGYAPMVFRSCLVPGRPYERLSPFGVEPEESNLRIAEKLPLAAAAGLWGFAEDALKDLSTLHAAGLAHGDVQLHNLVVCPAPLDLVVVDFEAAVRRESPERSGLASAVRGGPHTAPARGRLPSMRAGPPGGEPRRPVPSGDRPPLSVPRSIPESDRASPRPAGLGGRVVKVRPARMGPAGAHRRSAGVYRCLAAAYECSAGAYRCSAGAHRCSAGAHRCSAGAYRCSAGAYRCSASAYRCSASAYRCSASARARGGCGLRGLSAGHPSTPGAHARGHIGVRLHEKRAPLAPKAVPVKRRGTRLPLMRVRLCDIDAPLRGRAVPVTGRDKRLPLIRVRLYFIHSPLLSPSLLYPPSSFRLAASMQRSAAGAHGSRSFVHSSTGRRIPFAPGVHRSRSWVSPSAEAIGVWPAAARSSRSFESASSGGLRSFAQGYAPRAHRVASTDGGRAPPEDR